MLTIPLLIKGTDSKGRRFEADGRTVTLNRHGARIQTPHPLRAGQVLQVVNLVGRREAEFRVVGPISPLTEKGGEWGMEFLDPQEDIWGIQFPPPAAGAESKALLECRDCHAVALMQLSLVEVEVLETSGIISRPCATCEVVTPWGVAEKQVAMSAPPEEAAMMAEAHAQVRRGTRTSEQRRHRRIALQLPVLLRDYYGGGEITKTENISKGGFCFVSEKTYHVGEGMIVICPYNPGGQNIEVRARMVRRRNIEGTTRKIYGVRYDTAT